MATGESVEGDTLIAKAGGNGKSRRGKLNSPKSNNSNSPSAGERVNGVGIAGEAAAIGRGGSVAGGGGAEGRGGTTAKMKRPQYCTICKNHNKQVLKKRHKCPYSDCQCSLCQLSRRVQCIMCHQQRLWRFRKSMEKNGTPQGGNEVSTAPNSSSASPSSSNSSSSSSSSSFPSERDCQLQESVVDDPLGGSELTNGKERLKGERSGKQQVCDKCRNHDVWVLKRGHKGKCPYENCTCQYCSFTIKRRALMKHQQRVRRAQATTSPTKGSQDYPLEPSENGVVPQASNIPSPNEASVSSPDGNFGIRDQEPQNNNNHNTLAEGNVTWSNCSNEKPEDLTVSTKIARQSSRGSPPCQKPEGDPAFFHSSTDATLVQQPQTNQMSLQQPNNDSKTFQQPSPNTTSFQQSSRESTPFQENQDIAISYQQQSSDSIVFHPQSRDSATQQQSAAEHMSFQQSFRDSTPFHQPNRQTLQFQEPMEDSTSFQQSNRESVTNIDDTSFQQPTKTVNNYHQINQSMNTFHQPVRESAAFHQQNRESRIPFQHPNRESIVFKQRRDLSSLQMSNKESVLFSEPCRDANTPFEQQNRYQDPYRDANTPFEQQSRFQEPYRDANTPFEQRGRFPEHYRDANTPFEQQSRNSTPFQQAITVNSTQSYQNLGAEEPMHYPLKCVKTEPNLENDTVYYPNGIQNNIENYQAFDANGNLTPPSDFASLQQNISSMRSYNNVPRSHLQPKFGAQPEDMLLRHWPTNDIEIDNSHSPNERNSREDMICSPITPNPQHLNIPQSPLQMQSQMHHQPPQHLIGATAEVDFKPQVSIVGSWGSSNASMSNHTTPRLQNNIAQTPCSAMHLTAHDEFAPQSAHSQGAWWQPVRMAGLERTNSC